MINISIKQRATYVGILILIAYSMLAYTLTNNKILGLITDVISGLAVIGIPLLLFPVFNSNQNKFLNYAYILSRIIEGTLMIIGGIFIVIPTLEPYRASIYTNFHIYFFITGALFFYILFYRTRTNPKFISIWGIIAILILLVINALREFGFNSKALDALLAPIILNELFLAIWLMIKGFKNENSNIPSGVISTIIE